MAWSLRKYGITEFRGRSYPLADSYHLEAIDATVPIGRYGPLYINTMASPAGLTLSPFLLANEYNNISLPRYLPGLRPVDSK